MLRATSQSPRAKRVESPVAVTIFPVTLPRTQAVSTPIEALAAKARTRYAGTVHRSLAPSRFAQPEPPVASSGLSTAPLAEALPASAPLRLDPQTIGRAIAGSEGDVRRMERRSGAELESPRASRSQALAGAVAEIGVPDCLAPNGGGSLLSAPILLVRALQGKCK
ncbi:MAG: hypothetical protein ABIQ06_06265 [Caldimonas sp.]